MNDIEIRLPQTVSVSPATVYEHLKEAARRKINGLVNEDCDSYFIEDGELVGLEDFGHHRGGISRQIIKSGPIPGRPVSRSQHGVDEAKELVRALVVIKSLILDKA